MTNNNPIAIFDSGIGGLTVFKEVSRLLPDEDIVYLGDTARVPYGIRSPETVTRYSFECADFLIKQNIKMLVVACNTVSAISLYQMRENIPVPVIGVIEPGSSAAARSTINKRIGIIGTEATIRSNAYLKAIKLLNKEIEVFSLACPLFVPLVEEGWTDGIIARLVVERYLKEILDKNIDTLILGCTHYPLLKDVISDVSANIFLIDSAIETAMVVKQEILAKGLQKTHQNTGQGRGTWKFFVTDSPEKFVKVGERFLQSDIKDIEKIKLP